MARRLKFPDPTERSPKTPAVMCTAERVLGLYNQDTGEGAQRISKTVREWFHAGAHQEGWAGGHYVPDAQTGHTAGCLLWAGESTLTVRVEANTVILVDTDEAED